MPNSVAYVPVLSSSLDVVSLPQAPEGLMPVPSELLEEPGKGAVMQVGGEELTPDLNPGDLVLVERGRRPQGQCIVAVRSASGIVFQHLSMINGTMVLTAGNPDFSYLNQLLDASRDSIILGQALVLVWRALL